MGKRSVDLDSGSNISVTDFQNVTREKVECWETSVGQELAKLVLFDMYMVIFSVLFFDFFRGLMVRYLNPIWPFWDLEGLCCIFNSLRAIVSVWRLFNFETEILYL